ncbi:membrane protein insertion efficiency factor YidD [candidate division WWE3 bacterium CG08_land_8_20_14_0_20_43_13]|uniref:Putative membrane protein insertion efficiency factor n=1 Tax=candidate division WWE3 bacterium CG08_land_8_20_14_0_20_43_13 TaxID=1975087 RepID=A0A2H0X885_UNCKA|nr:MAG: membrane protein insertion efficiency factor YidD [candidate division WWE3 bacterium CG08_land_8_20_14_0_20_43_13]
MAKFVLVLIRLYQKYLSLDTGWLSVFKPRWVKICRFEPSCSEYTFQAISKYGLLLGVWLSFRRVCRCHPFSAGGHDPVP